MPFDKDVGARAYELARVLFPLPRSLVSRANAQTNDIICKEISAPVTRLEIPSGTEIGGWEVPHEWNLIHASLRDQDGNEYLDLQSSHLYVVVGSRPCDLRLSRLELEAHLHSLPELPTAIPYVTNYYGSGWGLCLPQHVRDSLPDGDFHVTIRVEKDPGYLELLEVVVPGTRSEEVFFATYNCHPQLANNELSGPVVWVQLLDYVQQLSTEGRLKYTYRFYMGPETLGAIHYLSRRVKHLKEKVIAGFELTCIGAERGWTVMPSRTGESYADRIIHQALRDEGLNFNVSDFRLRGSDERQWCYPTVDLPVAYAMSAKYHDYPEYHTSLDNLDFISPQALGQAYQLYKRVIELIEQNLVPLATTVGEPKLDCLGLYPSVNVGGRSTAEAVRTVLSILAMSDGSNDLINLARLLVSPTPELLEYIHVLEDASVLVTSEISHGNTD